MTFLNMNEFGKITSEYYNNLEKIVKMARENKSPSELLCV